MITTLLERECPRCEKRGKFKAVKAPQEKGTADNPYRVIIECNYCKHQWRGSTKRGRDCGRC